MTLVQQIEKAADLVAGARYAVALTGAGISTPSGIPDFRSPGSGLWEKVNPMVVASIFAFRLQPQAFYNWLHPLAELMLNAQPNPAHHALADLENMGLLKAVITQNVDNLHQKAGSTKVYELHGHLREATCMRCHKIVPASQLVDRKVCCRRSGAPVRMWRSDETQRRSLRRATAGGCPDGCSTGGGGV